MNEDSEATTVPTIFPPGASDSNGDLTLCGGSWRASVVAQRPAGATALDFG
jgi:hypothetical protein